MSVEIAKNPQKNNNSKILSRNSVSKKNPRFSSTLITADDENINEEINFKESRVGIALTNVTTKRVIFIVLLLITAIPFLDLDYYSNFSKSPDYNLKYLIDFNNFKKNKTNSDSERQEIFDLTIQMGKKQNFPVIELSVKYFDIYKIQDTNGLENINMNKYEVDNEGKMIVLVQKKIRFEAILNIIKTIFVCLILSIGALSFSKDADKYALHPLERMANKVYF